MWPTETTACGIRGGIPSNEHGYVSGQNRLQELTRDATGTPTKETIRKRMEWLFHDPKILPDELVDIRLKIYSNPAMQEVLHTQDRKVYNLIEKIPKLQAPILFFWTTHNPTCPWPVADKVHQSVPGSRFVLVDKSGHRFVKDSNFTGTRINNSRGISNR